MENDIRFFLPYGEILRTQLVKPELTSSNLKSVIKSKGIFLSSYEKLDTVPVLMRSMLSPEEYNDLLDLKKQRVDNVKYRTNQIPWKGDKNLFKSLPKNLDIQDLVEKKYRYNPGFSINNVTSFVPVGSEMKKAEISFSVEEHSDIKTIGERKHIYKGKLTLELKDDGSLHLSTLKNFTSKSTQDVVNLISNKLERHFKEIGSVDNQDSYERIMFNHFTNKHRFLFFLKLIDNFDLLTFVRIIDISLSPDPDQVLPDEGKLLLEDIDKLNIKGKTLRRHKLLSEEKYRDSLILSSMTLKFDFKHSEGNGKCEVEFSFPDFDLEKRDQLEFQFHVQKFSLEKAYRTFANKRKIQDAIYSSIEETKMIFYNQLKNDS